MLFIALLLHRHPGPDVVTMNVFSPCSSNINKNFDTKEGERRGINHGKVNMEIPQVG